MKQRIATRPTGGRDVVLGRRLGLRRWPLALAAAATACALVSVAVPATAAQAPGLPSSFFGVSVGVSMFSPRVNLDQQAARIRGTGTGSIRFPIYWSLAQPSASWAAVPPGLRGQFVSVGGIPTTFAAIDRQVLAFARHGLQMLPDIVEAPAWARVDPQVMWSPPADPQAYGRFFAAVVRRYGVGGVLWRAHPGLGQMAPRWWQVWNEPAGGETPEGHTIFWVGSRPYEPRYLAMVRAARRGARAADPHARIVLAGFFGRSWDALQRIYAFGGAGSFDAVAVHPYADTSAHVLTILRYVRAVMVQHHQGRLPLLVTETSWVSSKGRAPPSGGPAAYGIETTESQQASNLGAEYLLLAAHRRELDLQGLFWYTWLAAEPSSDPFDYAGLLRLTPSGRIQAKPAFSAYDRVLRRLER